MFWIKILTCYRRYKHFRYFFFVGLQCRYAHSKLHTVHVSFATFQMWSKKKKIICKSKVTFTVEIDSEQTTNVGSSATVLSDSIWKPSAYGIQNANHSYSSMCDYAVEYIKHASHFCIGRGLLSWPQITNIING